MKSITNKKSINFKGSNLFPPPKKSQLSKSYFQLIFQGQVGVKSRYYTLSIIKLLMSCMVFIEANDHTKLSVQHLLLKDTYSNYTVPKGQKNTFFAIF